MNRIVAFVFVHCFAAAAACAPQPESSSEGLVRHQGAPVNQQNKYDADGLPFVYECTLDSKGTHQDGICAATAKQFFAQFSQPRTFQIACDTKLAEGPLNYRVTVTFDGTTLVYDGLTKGYADKFAGEVREMYPDCTTKVRQI